MTDFAGELETHITIAAGGSAEVIALRQWALERSLKCTHIVLQRGVSRSQPMLTRWADATLTSARRAAAELSQELVAAGFAVTRLKIEAASGNAEVPQTDEDARRQPSDRYFEHHVKLLLDPGTDLAPLLSLAERHVAHLSKNALRQRDDEREERFVSQRCWSVGRPEAWRRLDALLTELHATGREILHVDEEFVLYDDHLDLDAGWLPC